jgi:xanthine dehydrogenase accessory factor
LLARTQAHQLVARTLTLATGAVFLRGAVRGQGMQFDGSTLTTVFGPQWRLLLIGAGQLSQAVAQMATMLDFEVLVCDPREGYMPTPDTDIKCIRHIPGMPDDVVREMVPDAHTAIVALTPDPKLVDMALLEALQSGAFYVGAFGSLLNQQKRKQRLAEQFGLSETELKRLQGPVGLNLGAQTSAEIAISILAEIVQFKNGIVPSMIMSATSMVER